MPVAFLNIHKQDTCLADSVIQKVILYGHTGKGLECEELKEIADVVCKNVWEAAANPV